VPERFRSSQKRRKTGQRIDPRDAKTERKALQTQTPDRRLHCKLALDRRTPFEIELYLLDREEDTFRAGQT
jgi:hypothetical protein